MANQTEDQAENAVNSVFVPFTTAEVSIDQLVEPGLVSDNAWLKEINDDQLLTRTTVSIFSRWSSNNELCTDFLIIPSDQEKSWDSVPRDSRKWNVGIPIDGSRLVLDLINRKDPGIVTFLKQDPPNLTESEATSPTPTCCSTPLSLPTPSSTDTTPDSSPAHSTTPSTRQGKGQGRPMHVRRCILVPFDKDPYPAPETESSFPDTVKLNGRVYDRLQGSEGTLWTVWERFR